MLFKLLKYDLRALYKYWWICAALSLVLSAVGGVSYNVLSTRINTLSLTLDPFMTIAIYISALIGVLVSFVGVSAFLFATELFVFIRFYKHFFSDEGYLTFTLPVKRSSLLNSKIISAFMIHLSTIAVILVGVCEFVLLGIPMTNLRIMGKSLYNTYLLLWGNMGDINFAILVFEIIIASLILILTTYLFILISITFGSIIVKKGKVFAAIGIYYLGNSIISGVSQILSTFAYSFLPGILIVMTGYEAGVTLWMIFLPVIVLLIALTVAMYALELYMLDRKLNLA